MILLDLEMPRMDGLALLRTLRQEKIDLPVVVITAHGSIEKAVEAMKEGAFDFLPKPLDPKHLEIVACKALERERLKREVEILAGEAGVRHQLIAGKSAEIQEAIETARKAASSNATVLLLGESGTGKEIFARAVHNWSERKEKSFVAINCVGLSRELLESELFGHEKGAFTGADRLKKGKLELANGGTVFLDEIGDISQEIQTKLLRFLQEREFERVGGNQSLRVDVRIIAATNRDLEANVRESRFREDLYHRLNVIPIALPPLRNRKEDIPALARHFMERFSKETKKSFSEITREAEEILRGYEWPGNVRELGNVIERAIVLGQGPRIGPQDLPLKIASTPGRAENLSYRESLEAFRRDLVLRALKRAEGNRAETARTLGLSEKYLFKLLRTLRIADKRSR
jgi:DNA-binding NtrC family response regulator